jgi:hypothetical protein
MAFPLILCAMLGLLGAGCAGSPRTLALNDLPFYTEDPHGLDSRWRLVRGVDGVSDPWGPNCAAT